MKRAFRLLSLMMVLILVAVVLSSCGKKNSFVGQWALESNSRGEIEQMTLRADGTGTGDGVSISWSVDGNEFTWSWMLGSTTYEYRLEGDRLYLDDIDTSYDDEIVYKKK